MFTEDSKHFIKKARINIRALNYQYKEYSLEILYMHNHDLK